MVPELQAFADQCFRNAKNKGFHDKPRSFGEDVALIHAELSEALEEHRKGMATYEIYYQNGKPEGIPVELADVIIRVMDLVGAHNIPIDRAIAEKLEYNATRPHRHGGKVL